MSDEERPKDESSPELKKIMKRYMDLADDQSPAAVPGHGNFRLKVDKAPPEEDARDREEIDREFREVVDRFIHLANEQMESVQREHVSLALLYAAARFNSFIVASHAPSQDKFKADRKAAFKFFSDEYHRMLTENLDDYERVYQTD